MVCIDITSPPRHAPSAGLSGKTSCSMTGFNRGNCENGSKTNDYLLKLKAVGLNGVLYNLPKTQWSMDIDMWPGIGVFDIYMYLI